MNRVLRRTVGCLCTGLLLGCALALAVGPTGGQYQIRAHQIGSGGTGWLPRQSPSYRVRDDVASSLPAMIVRSQTYENRGGLSYMIADPRGGDLDENGLLNEQDWFLFATAWKTQAGEANYRFAADLVENVADRRINEIDLLRMIELQRKR